MDSDAPTTIVLTVATAEWRETIDHLEERCERIVAETLKRSAAEAWLRRGEVSVLLSDDDQVRELNRRYRGRDRATNVLSFPTLDFEEGKASFPPPTGHVLLGDIALSFQRLSQEAVEEKKPILDHFAHLLVHGTLHLLGYDHQNDEQAAVMEGIEETILASLGMAAPYDQRDSINQWEALP